MKRIRIPLPPIQELSRILDEVDRLFTHFREVEAAVDANLKRAHSLRQAVFSKAFSGAPA